VCICTSAFWRMLRPLGPHQSGALDCQPSLQRRRQIPRLQHPQVLCDRVNITLSFTMSDSPSDISQPPLPEEGDLVGLTEVDPSPVDETPTEFKADYFPSSESRGSPTSTSTLGLGGHGLGYYRMFTSSSSWVYIANMSSAPRAEILVLRLHCICVLAHCQYLPNTPGRKICFSKQSLSPSHEAVLPIRCD
jgi:hypothetical protein